MLKLFFKNVIIESVLGTCATFVLQERSAHPWTWNLNM